MLLGVVILLSLRESTGQSTKSTTVGETITTTNEAPPSITEKPSPLQLVAKPDYPVAAGQRVHLCCSAPTEPAVIIWFRKHLHNETWKQVGNGLELILTEPEQSGVYHCNANIWPSQQSPNHTVFIIAIQTTVGEKLGIAAFVLSLSIIICLPLLHIQRFCHTVTTPRTAVEGVGKPEVVSKGEPPQANSDKDVYMNYTSTSAYSNLDPTIMTGENVYSSLS
ncbi:uncharacterized protein PAE49_019664 isoform 2-T2 [Odontesthes bonariensis]|uniref:uncharacterized protein LOC142366461 n=1 Tax=Odontesthes bonariensis TaxID=219752 RepID=UPI003F5806B2